MLRVKTYLAPSEIEGIGLFASEPIPRGTLIWKFNPAFDMKVDLRDVPEDDVHVRETLMRYGYQPDEEPVYILCGDNARFMNHSPTPNADDVGDLTIARVDIAAGEEITCNYAKFDYRFARTGFAVGWA
jgi:SET domain-containing protein